MPSTHRRSVIPVPAPTIDARHFSAKHYEAVARVIVEIEAGLPGCLYQDHPTDEIMELITARFANLFSLDNPKFDGFRFNNVARGRKK